MTSRWTLPLAQIYTMYFHWHLHSLHLFLHAISWVFIGTVCVSPKVKLFRRKKYLDRKNECISRSSRINVYLFWRLVPQLSSNQCTVLVYLLRHGVLFTRRLFLKPRLGRLPKGGLTGMWRFGTQHPTVLESQH